MKLLLKFNLVFVLVFLIGLGVTGVLTRQTARAQRAGRGAAARALPDREGTGRARPTPPRQVAPLLETQMKYAFLPQSVPAFSATEVLAKLQKNHPEYAYKEATLNPTNPRDRAVEWEADVIAEFRKAPDTKEFVGERDTPAGRALYIARPIRITDAGLPALPQHGGGGAAHADRQVRPGQRLRLAARRGGRRAGGLGADGGADGAGATRRGRCSWACSRRCSWRSRWR